MCVCSFMYVNKRLFLLAIASLTFILVLTRSVRQAVLVATSMVLLVVPGHFLLTDLQMDIMETKEWLQSES